jgi:uncharacterized membrane protein YwaF
MSSKSSTMRIYFMSGLAVGVIIFVSYLVASAYPSIPVTDTQSILQTLISLDGVLFGFSAVMVGLVFGRQKGISKRLVKYSTLLILVSFWCYFVSLWLSFNYIFLRTQKGVFTPIFVTLIGAVCSSIYMVMLFLIERE